MTRTYAKATIRRAFDLVNALRKNPETYSALVLRERVNRACAHLCRVLQWCQPGESEGGSLEPHLELLSRVDALLTNCSCEELDSSDRLHGHCTYMSANAALKLTRGPNQRTYT